MGQPPEAIAVIGMDCRFPGDGDNVETLWKMLTAGKGGWSTIPENRMNTKGWFHPDPHRPGGFHIRGGHFLKHDIAAFDAPFFSISTSEAMSMDPQQRILLEVVYNAFERAGVTLEALSGSDTSVWCGSFVRDYEQPCMRDPASTPAHAATGNGVAILANRISHVFDLAGTSQSIDTGCSASLVAVHEACKSLLVGECSMAVAAGVGLIFSPNTIVPMANLDILSPDGRCFTFDERANGYGRGEGIGAVILKRFSDAIRDNDTIRAVIRATSSNQDGRTQGITLPSRQRQIDNMTSIYRRAGLDPLHTAYVECHGTGTPAGDQIELEAVSATFCKDRPLQDPLIVGSIKTNVGHLEGSSGIAGLIKGILVVENAKIPAHFDFTKANPRLNFGELQVKVADSLLEWPVPGPRRASVNSFGFGGTNAHAILEDAPHYMRELGVVGHHNSLSYCCTPIPFSSRNAGFPTTLHSTMKLFVFSGHDEASLQRVIQANRRYLEGIHRDPAFLDDYAYTLFSRRSRLPSTTFTMAETITELKYKLDEMDVRPLQPMRFTRSKGDVPVIALVFAGQGAQWYGMGQELLRYGPFANSFHLSNFYIQDRLDQSLSLWDELHRPKESTRINEARIAQPMTAAVQIALVDLLKACCIDITAVVGHSSGEIAAAYACGLLTHEDAIKIAFHRGRLSMETRPGAMLAVPLSPKALDPYQRELGWSVLIACDNGPSSVTVSGDLGPIEKLKELLAQDNIESRKLPGNRAYHSYEHMSGIADSYSSAIGDINPLPYHRGNVRMFSSVFGEELQVKQKLDATYWKDNLVGTIYFHDAVKDMFTSCKGLNTVMEVSPQRVWKSTIQSILAEKNMGGAVKSYSSMLVYERDAWESTLQTLGELWARGANIKLDWAQKRWNGSQPWHLVDAPTYPWDHSRRYWHESHISKDNRFRAHGREDLIGAPVDLSTPFEPRWRGFSRLVENPWISHHQVQKAIIYPAAGLIAMAVEAAKQLADPSEVVGYEVASFKILKPMIMPTTEQGLENMISCRALELDLAHTSEITRYSFMIQSKPLDSAWMLHATGNIIIHNRSYSVDEQKRTADQLAEYLRDHQRINAECSKSVIPRQLYERLDIVGMTYGPLFRNIVELRHRPDAGVVTSVVQIPDTKANMPHQFEFDHVIHPATLDAIMQTVFGTGDELMLPCDIESIFIAADLPKGADPKGADKLFRGHCTLVSSTPDAAEADIVMFDDQLQRAAVVIRKVGLKAMPRSVGGGGFLPTDRNLCSQIVWKPDILTNRGTSFEDFLDRLAHKDPAISVLQVNGNTRLARWVIDHLRGPDSSTPRFSRYDISVWSPNKFAALVDFYETTGIADRLHHVGHDALPSRESRDCKYDLIIVSGQQHTEWHTMLRHNMNPERGEIYLGGFENDFDNALSDPCPDIPWHASTLASEIWTPWTPIKQSHSQLVVLVPSNKGLFLKQHAYLYDLLKSTGVEEVIINELHDVRPLLLADSSGTPQEILATPIISLLEWKYPVLSRMTNNEFDLIKALLSTVQNMLWVTGGGLADGGRSEPCDPCFGAIVGLARTLRSENPTKHLVTFDIGNRGHGNPEALSRDIVHVFTQAFGPRLAGQIQETEYAIIDGEICIPRLVTMPAVNNILERGIKPVRQPHCVDLKEAGSSGSATSPCDHCQCLDVQVLDNGADTVGSDTQSQVKCESAMAKEAIMDPQETWLSPHATYLLVGGLGGIGRSIAELLVERGARHLAFFSRSGGNEAGKSFIDELVRKGVVACSFEVDVSKEDEVKLGVREVQERLRWPIAGVMQCAAVLHDAPFEKLTFADWKKIFAPKALGAWYLHKHLPHDLDFFICLSSSSGIIGNRGQAAYAAGNTVQDAVARCRTAEGKPCSVSLDVGIVLDAGIVASDETLLDTMRAAGFFGMRLKHLHWLILQAITPDANPELQLPAQVVTTVGTGGLVLQNEPSDPFWTRTPLFAFLNQVDAPPGSNVGGLAPFSSTKRDITSTTTATGDIRAAVMAAKGGKEEAVEIVTTAIIALTAKLRGTPVAEFRADLDFSRYGINSMDSMAILGWISREFGVALQTLEGVLIKDVAKAVADRVLEDDAHLRMD